MTAYSTKNESPRAFDLFANPFHVLCIEPGSTTDQVQHALHAALEKKLAPADLMVHAQAIALNPSLRLPHELGYPIDSSNADVERIYRALASDASLDTHLTFASRLPSLSKANYLGHLASRQPASEALLKALVEAHASINVSQIFDRLKTVRAAAGCVAPSLLSTNQGMVELLDRHARAAISRYQIAQDAAGPVSACAQDILAKRDLHHTEAMGQLLIEYRHSFSAQQSKAIEDIETACAVLTSQSDIPSLEKLKEALQEWTSVCRPILLWDSHHGSRDARSEIVVDNVRAAIANLAAQHRPDLALKLAEFAQEVFRIVPIAAALLAADASEMATLLEVNKQRIGPDVVSHQASNHEDRESRWLGSHFQMGARSAALGLILSLSIGCAAAVLFYVDRYRSPRSPSSVTNQSEAEAMPPIGTGQHLNLSGIRYCTFQEARLLAIKPEVRGTEDTRIFNELAADYNSRCSDFFFRESDLATVKAELIEMSPRLSTEARQLMSTWPGHSSPPPAR